jgi:hyperosmotically inducible periplasmic protein
MIRGLLRLTLVALVLVAAAFFVFGYWSNGGFRSPSRTTFEPPAIDTATARRQGAELGEKAAVVAAKAEEAMEDGSLTAKIKAKMVLDDLVQARAIDVTTDGRTVTLSGTVNSEKERQRAVQLAAETEGVARVVDQLRVRPS